MSNNEPKILFLFIDESGNFDFTPKGTKYFVLTCISTTEPVSQRDEFLSLKYELLGDGIEQEYFHATEDKQKVRDTVFSFIEKLNDFEVHSVVAQKNKTNWSLYTKIDTKKNENGKGFKFTKKQVEENFYKQLGEMLTGWVFKRYRDIKNIGETGKIIFIKVSRI